MQRSYTTLATNISYSVSQSRRRSTIYRWWLGTSGCYLIFTVVLYEFVTTILAYYKVFVKCFFSSLLHFSVLYIAAKKLTKGMLLKFLALSAFQVVMKIITNLGEKYNNTPAKYLVSNQRTACIMSTRALVLLGI